MLPVKKILYIVTQAEWGGAQKYIFDLTNAFLKEGMDIGVAAGIEQHDLFDQLAGSKSENFTLFRVKHLIRFINPYRDFLAFWELAGIIRKFKPDVVHLNSSKAGILGTMAALYNGVGKRVLFFGKKKSVKVVYTAHGFVFNENLPILVYLCYVWAEKISSWFRDKIIVISEYDFKIAMEKHVIKAEKMALIHNGIDLRKRDVLLSKIDARGKLKEFAASSQNFDTSILESPQTQIVGTVANFYKNKGLRYLIEAAKAVIKDMPNTAFILIGKGEMEKKLRKIVHDYRLEKNFLIISNIPAGTAFAYFHAVDIFCLSSLKEGLSYTLLEALMAGVAIVATNVGGNPDIVKDGFNGFMAPSKDIEALAEKLKILLKNDELRNKMGVNSYDMADNFRQEEMIKKTREVYEDITN